MLIKNLIYEDFVNYKVPALFIATARCSFKCPGCQNRQLADLDDILIDNDTLVDRYLSNPITHAIVIGGLEPFDQFDELLAFCEALNKKKVTDDLVVYTGYKEGEIPYLLAKLCDLNEMRNVIVKFGRFVSDQESHFDEILGVNLASDNQYARRYPATINICAKCGREIGRYYHTKYLTNGKNISPHNIMALQKKINGSETTKFLCFSCLQKELGITEDMAFDMVYRYKVDGCTMFE